MARSHGLADFGWMEGFGGGLSPDTFPLPITFPSPPSLQLPEMFCRLLNFLLSPAVGFAAHPRRDSDVVESVRHKLGELTDLHGLKRWVLAWP